MNENDKTIIWCWGVAVLAVLQSEREKRFEGGSKRGNVK